MGTSVWEVVREAERSHPLRTEWPEPATRNAQTTTGRERSANSSCTAFPFIGTTQQKDRTILNDSKNPIDSSACRLSRLCRPFRGSRESDSEILRRLLPAKSTGRMCVCVRCVQLLRKITALSGSAPSNPNGSPSPLRITYRRAVQQTTGSRQLFSAIRVSFFSSQPPGKQSP